MNSVFCIDNFHIHDKNFTTLYTYLRNNKINIIYGLKKDSVLFKFANAHGNYRNIINNVGFSPSNIFLTIYKHLKQLPKEKLYSFSLFNIELFPITIQELLSFVLPLENWRCCNLLYKERDVFEKAFRENYDDLLLCMSAAYFWINHWINNIDEVIKHDIAFLFSGSYIYTYCFLEVFRCTKVRVFILESLFNGENYYLEERYHPIANNCLLSSNNFYFYLLKKYYIDIEKEFIKAINIISKKKNKNVLFIEKTPIPRFKDNRKNIILILGQVLNDFSNINTKGIFLSSLYVYKEIIKSLLEKTEYNIIFKGHPYEEKKINLYGPLTINELKSFFKNSDRLLILNDFNMESLFDVSSHVITISSQSGIESALYGKKTLLVGKAFYGNKGFTKSFTSVEELIDYVLKNKNSYLNPEEYIELKKFISILINKWTIYNNGKQDAVIMQRLSVENIVSLEKNNITELNISKTFTNKIFSAKDYLMPQRNTFKSPFNSLIKIISPDKITCKINQKNIFKILIENKSDFKIVRTPLYSQKGEEIKLSYHILQGNIVIVSNGLRTPLTVDISEKEELAINILSPSTPGIYTILIDLVYEGVCWFKIDQKVIMKVEA